MAVVDLSTSTITDDTATEPWKGSGSGGAEALFVTTGLATIAANNDDGSIYRVARLPTKARVVSIRLVTAGITAGTSFDVGLYLQDSTVKDADAYASAVDCSSALVGTEVAYEARALTNHRKRVWEDAGDSSDPGLNYDIALTGNTVGSGAGTILAIVTYVITP